MLSNTASTFNDPDAYPDVEIICDGQKWLCHKVILSRSSEWFQRAFNGDFKERDAKSIELQEDFDEPAAAIEAMLKYCYTLQYENATEQSPVSFDIRMFALAEKYFIKNLDHLAAQKLKSTLNALTPDNFEKLYTESIAQAYTTTINPQHILRNTIITTLLARSDLETFTASETYKNLITNIPASAFDLSRALAHQNQALKDEAKNFWFKTVAAEGSIYHYNSTTDESRWVVPSSGFPIPLPPGFSPPPVAPPGLFSSRFNPYMGAGSRSGSS